MIADFTNSLYIAATPTERFELVWNKATPKEVDEYKDAFKRYNVLLRCMAEDTGHTLETACGVFAALSPGNDYFTNLRDARTVLRSVYNYKEHEVTVHTYGNNRNKAWQIAMGLKKPGEIITADKTRNFFFNLLDPEDSRYVTIDGRMYNIWNGERRPLQSADTQKRIPSIRKKIYHEIADDVKAYAFKKGLIPCEAQAVLWHVWRRLHSIKMSPQLSFWDYDVECAGIGFQKL